MAGIYTWKMTQNCGYKWDMGTNYMPKGDA